ncbi:MAG: BlaI/MecI/CopY family transcriptional regulator [Deltaproteobacteria bacterium]|nr:BlaI/MecI/CopY family transcriptional regulator [Deltaproteobacteria bacterium]
MAENRILTSVELELMNILWELGEASVKQVLEKLSPERKLAYTSVSTILRILEKKAVIYSRREGRTHFYIPKVTKASYGKRTVDHIVTSVFSETPSELAKALLSSDNLSLKDLMEIKSLIDERMENHDQSVS